ncbi:restriction endonuclease subunit S [Sinomicrobium soli]|uniref:restriction endonuclease subunit S n=1 Tax=Sinomicrobium sp. N-1-3-6 TaxID=2219864 RepID=UPI00137526D9|nr:restriction endonuclease subunit S [Sinomicrobium sp. N-1-3-6]
MKHTYKTYIPWMPELPSHWKLERVKNYFNFSCEVVGENYNDFKVLSLSVKGNGVIVRDMESRKGKHSLSMDKYMIIQPNSIVLCLFDMDVTPRIVGHCENEGIITSAYTNIIPKKNIHSKFYYYFFLQQDYNKSLMVQGTGVRTTLTNSQFGAVKIPLPPLEEQIAIANYLDRQSKKIKHFIRKKQAFIELLKEQRQAVISRAVTKGINPDITLKDSGIQWLGDIPEHWEVRKLRYCGQCQNGLNKGGEFFGKGFPFFGYGDIYNNEILPQIPSGLVESTEEEQANCSVEKGDVFFTRTSEIVDEIAIASTCHQTIPNATFSGFLIRFRPTENLLFEGYSTYYFRNELLREYFVKEMNIITRASMSQDLLKSLPIVLPPIEEQVMIYNYIKTETAKIDQAIAKAEKEIELIKEYREAMIAEAVLGKLKVSEL